MNTPLRGGGAMNEPALKFNRETGRYELVVTISVDAEIFRRLLYKYVEENHIDPTDLDAWAKAIEVISRAEKWLNHPHVTVQTGMQQAPEPLQEAALMAPTEAALQERSLPVSEDLQALRELAQITPEQDWPALMTPIPDSLSREEKRPYYWKRHREYQVLEQVRKEREAQAPDLERLHIIASATNGARLK